jgi:predicted dehydrogenase
VAGSGSLGDLCAHTIDAARFITGEEITEVNGAILETFVKQRQVLAGGSGGEISGAGAKTAGKKVKSTVDDAVLFTCRFEGGAVGSFEATRLATGYKNALTLEVHGDKGAIRFDFERLCELDWYDATLPAKLQGWSTINVSSGAAGHPYCNVWWPTAHATGYEHSFINQAADMINVLAGREPVIPLPDFADAWETQKVLHAVTLSAQDRSPVKLSEIK